ncbi:hypothetical protein [Marinilabilia rubra]|uniref:Uncharacterized protein n=1 Tax=Marinilabilia rubra TaxID=2162893 RepID=A0A2U2B5P7_9BACT|nr:hypothetical protein [Marinilabilia rubra]PWD98362.1 hypothetical protein DDZ16_15645 [Marinilabilia rubra]
MSGKVLITVLVVIFAFAQTSLNAQECQSSETQSQEICAEKKARLEQLADMDFEELMDMAVVSENSKEAIKSNSRDLTIISENEINQSSAKNLIQLLKEVSDSKCSEYILDGKKLNTETNQNEKQALIDLPIQNIQRIEIKKENTDKENQTIKTVRIFTKG